GPRTLTDRGALPPAALLRRARPDRDPVQRVGGGQRDRGGQRAAAGPAPPLPVRAQQPRDPRCGQSECEREQERLEPAAQEQPHGVVVPRGPARTPPPGWGAMHAPTRRYRYPPRRGQEPPPVGSWPLRRSPAVPAGPHRFPVESSNLRSSPSPRPRGGQR